jgi:tryptophan-rich sensory protein
VIVLEVIGGFGAVFTMREIPHWYAKLKKPRLNPPSWVFGPVWTLLYGLMGASVFLIWQQGGDLRVPLALSAFLLQLIFNVLWSYLFFRRHDPFLALIDITLMWLAIVATIALFAPISMLAAWLLAPYLLWVSFASYLNFAIYRRNR